MTDYSELVKALRDEDNCNILDYIDDAAAAIEALEAEVEKYKRLNNALENLLSEDKEPKRGEWITIRLNNGGSYTGCSCCEAPIPTDTMLDYIPETESKYCYSCGAKMIGEQNVE